MAEDKTSRLGGETLARINEFKRNLVVLLVDTSGSMQKSVGELNAALRQFAKEDMPQNPVLAGTGELAIGQFYSDGSGSHVEWLTLSRSNTNSKHPFYHIRTVEDPDEVEAKGATPIGFAIQEALKVVAARKLEFVSGVPPLELEHRPQIYLLTDGRPEYESPSVLHRARTDLQAAEKLKKVLFFSMGVGGADMDLLNTLSVGGADNAYDLKSSTLAEVLKFASRSAEQAIAAMDGARSERTSSTDSRTNEVMHPGDARTIYMTVREKYRQNFFEQVANSPLGPRSR